MLFCSIRHRVVGQRGALVLALAGGALVLLFATSACGIGQTPAPNNNRDNSALPEKVGTGHRSDGIAGESPQLSLHAQHGLIAN